MALQNCPECGSNQLRWSKRRGVHERVATWIIGRPVRCRQCFHRFFPGRDSPVRRGGKTSSEGGRFLDYLKIPESRQ
jgi:hypothetical protein